MFVNLAKQDPGRARGNFVFVSLANTKLASGRKVKQEQEEISLNHVQAFSGASVGLMI